LGESAGICGQDFRQTGGNLGADLADIFLGWILVEFVSGQGNVIVEGDDRPELVAARLFLRKLVERLIGTRQIKDANVEKKFRIYGSSTQQRAADAIFSSGSANTPRRSAPFDSWRAPVRRAL